MFVGRDQVAMDLVGGEDEVVSKADFRDPFQLFAVEDAAGGVVDCTSSACGNRG